MKFTSLLVILLLSCLNAFAGTLSGNVKATGQSAVVLETVPAKPFPAPTQTAAVDQQGMKFTPALLVIQQGTTVVFSNDDNVPHNVFWPNISGNKKLSHNVGTFNKGKTLSFKYENAGNVPLLCNIHSEMVGTIVVSPSPYFAETDAAGNYAIKDVPDGPYKATAWDNGKATTVTVTVKGDTKLDFAPAK
ncbi:MAG: plastocyanin/azurin family copper-binding protein [Candidatus Sulfotelmatobacter sp.]